MKKENIVKNHFEKKSNKYDDNIYKLIPKYDEMLMALVNSIDMDLNQEFHVLDLGCGTGNLSDRIKEKYPKANFTCLDFSANMIDKTKERFKDYDDMEFIVGNFLDFTFPESYDIIVSSLAIHHLTDDEKKVLYKNIYNSLNNNGLFYNADTVKDSNDYLNNLSLEIWREHLLNSFEIEKVDEILAIAKKSDSPSILLNQLKYFKKLGFKDINVVWKYYNHAVFGAKK